MFKVIQMLLDVVKVGFRSPFSYDRRRNEQLCVITDSFVKFQCVRENVRITVLEGFDGKRF